MRFLLTFYKAKVLFVLGNSGQNLFMWLLTISIKATMSIHWKSHQQMDIFLFFYLALCAHETCFMTRPWKRMVCMYFCQQQASQHNTVVAGKSLYFCWKRKRKIMFWSGASFSFWMNLFTPEATNLQTCNNWINAVGFKPPPTTPCYQPIQLHHNVTTF